jgi:hypothetical protein
MVSYNFWKYSTIGLLALIIVGLSLPQASAHITAKTAHMLEHIYNFVDGIEAKTGNLPDDPADQSLLDSQLESIQLDMDEIQGSIDSISGGLELKTVRVITSGNPPDANFDFTDVLPLEEGKAYSGMVSGFFSLSVGSRGFVTCQMAGINEPISLVIVERTELTQNPEFVVNEDFACDRLYISFGDILGNGDAGLSGFAGNVQYFESTDITEIPS